MKKCIIAAALFATFSVSASQSNKIEFTREIPLVRGIKITEGKAEIALKGEELKAAATAELYTNSKDKEERVEVETRIISDNLNDHEDKIIVYIDGKEADTGGTFVDAGEFPVQARIDLDAGEIEQGQAKIITVLKIRG
ncbi:hypothetical protein [Vibrio cionasavignyae]|uniref:hypothetical protein n=1 Tax=Vibrio cionasavignyae TaxID=2910252 RepID=UPI003D147D43